MSADPAQPQQLQQPHAHAHADGFIDAQPLAEALRAGDRETIEAIVHKLAGQLESLKMESQLASMPRPAAAVAAASAGPLARIADEASGSNSSSSLGHHRRLSSIPNTTLASSSLARDSSDDLKQRDRRKRATMAPGLLAFDAPKASLVCAYCGMSLDDGSDMATKASLNSEIGYCCSNCEYILSFAGEPDATSSMNMAPATAAGTPREGAIPGSLQDGDAISLNAVMNDCEDPHGYFEPMAQHCDVCNTPLGDEYVNVLGRRFHVTHFTCDDCNIPLYALGGYLQDPSGANKFYCQRDYLQRFSPSCHACSVQITSGEMVVALGRTYHSDCFVCSICQSPFIGDVCYEHDSQPLCEWHWYIQNGLLCTECGGIIKNQCVLTRGKKYHQACAESKYGESAITFDEARRQIKANNNASTSANTSVLA